MAIVTVLNWSNERKNNNVKFHRAVVNLVDGDQLDFQCLRFSDLPPQIKAKDTNHNMEGCKY